jgi:predicted transcriptional regulator
MGGDPGRSGWYRDEMRKRAQKMDGLEESFGMWKRRNVVGREAPGGTYTIHTDGFEGYVQRAQKMSRGERIKPSFGITFESTMQVFEVFTAQRLRVVEVARTKPYSVMGLAKKLKRDPKSVRRDVKKLEQYGVVRTREAINPGHGRVKIVEPVAERFELRASF